MRSSALMRPSSLITRLAGFTWLPEFNVALFALLLHVPWELLQAPLFDGMSQAPHWEAVKRCLRAALGDAVITLLAFWIVAGVVRSRHWVVRPAAATVLLFTAAGATLTVLVEWLALSGAWYQGWAYAPQMPIVPLLGVGLAPLLQWILIPPLVVWLVHRQLGPGRPS